MAAYKKMKQKDPAIEFLKNLGPVDEVLENIGLGPLVRNTRMMTQEESTTAQLMDKSKKIADFNAKTRKLVIPLAVQARDERQQQLNALLKKASALAKEIRIMHDLEFPKRKDSKIYIVSQT